MTGKLFRTDQENSPPEYPQARLEMLFIETYLLEKGYCRKDLRRLPRKVARRLMIEASMYASNKLAEIETRSRLVQSLHGDF